MAGNHVNLVKLCVGINSVEALLAHRRQKAEQAHKSGQQYLSTHVTRMWPKREAELLNGGSLYWVIKGFIAARQEFLRFEERAGRDGIRRCALIMSPTVIRTQTAARRPFQGWRYLEVAQSPPDLPTERNLTEDLPVNMLQALAEIGLR